MGFKTSLWKGTGSTHSHLLWLSNVCSTGCTLRNFLGQALRWAYFYQELSSLLNGNKTGRLQFKVYVLITWFDHTFFLVFTTAFPVHANNKDDAARVHSVAPAVNNARGPIIHRQTGTDRAWLCQIAFDRRCRKLRLGYSMVWNLNNL